MNNVKTGKFKKALKRYFYETFRPRTRADYAEVLTRGESAGAAGRYPWLYMRVLLVCFALYAVCSLVKYVAPSASMLPVVVLLASLPVNLAFLIAVYELYPFRDLSLLTVLACAAVGGLLSAAFTIFGYYKIFDVDTPYLSALWTAFWEELTKAAAVVAAVYILGKRNPYFCLLAGVAIGVGFSFAEDMGYAYYYSCEVDTAVTRAICAPFGHPMWAGFFGWALASRRPFLNWRVYAAFAGSVALHFLWDLPLSVGGSAAVCSICAGTATAVFTVAVIFCRGKIRLARFLLLEERLSAVHSAADGGKQSAEQLSFADDGGKTRRARLSFAANAVAAAVAVVFCALALVGCYLPQLNSYKSYRSAQSAEEFVLIAQNGESFNADFSRRYSSAEPDYSYTVENGEKIYAVQIYAEQDYTIKYYYSLVKREEGQYFYLYNIVLEKDGLQCGWSLFAGVDGRRVYYFALNRDIDYSSIGVNDDGSVVYAVSEIINYDKTAESLMIASLAVLGAGGVCASALKISSIGRRKKDA